jgi:hypothetical protein
LFIPPGRYKITKILKVTQSGTVLQGAGPDRSVLLFPTPLNEIKPNWGATTSGRRTSNYSWSGGFIQISGVIAKRRLANVAKPAKRGDRSLVLSSTNTLQVGDDVRLTMTDTNSNSLATHLYAADPGPIGKLNGRLRESFSCRITRVVHGERRIELDRALRTDVRLEWKPVILNGESSVEEVGVEQLGFEFPNTPYAGHFTEVGFNAMAMSGVRNCWARNLRIHNADSGIFVRGINNTVEDLVLTSDREVEPSRQATGHHGVTLAGQDNLLTRFQVRTRFMHDVTVTSTSAGNVVSRGRGIDIALDHHRHAPHSNLFTDLDLGLGSRMFQSGGGADRGRHSGAYETFWGIRSQEPQSWPRGWSPDRINLVGILSQSSTIVEPNGKWFEVIPPDQLVPQDLHRAQLARRLERQQTPKPF